MSDISQEELRRMHPGPTNTPQRPDERELATIARERDAAVAVVEAARGVVEDVIYTGYKLTVLRQTLAAYDKEVAK